MKKLKCNPISEGIVQGDVILTKEPISFYGGVDMKTGIVIEKGHELEGKSIAGKILVFPHGKGSTVGSYVIYGLKKYGKAPLALVVEEAEAIIISGAILANIPCVDGIKISELENAKKIKVNANKGEVEIIE
ncbi:MAG TPA: DUF126 domain-containing protein [Nanoarchaeota archaeon]|nr:DUF126 domain-containing protein [Nanoarchaeota archaeon]